MDIDTLTAATQVAQPGAPDWPWHRVQYALAEVGLTATAVGLSLSPPVKQPTMAQVASRPNPRVQAAIAQAIGLSPLAIWPSRYDPLTGRPIGRTAWLRARGRDYNGRPLRETAA